MPTFSLSQVCVLAERLEQEKARGENLVRQDREAVVSFFQGLELLLHRKRDEYMAALDAASSELARSYDPLIEKLKDMQEEQLSLISLSSSVQDEDSPLAFLEKVHFFRTRVTSLTQIPMPQVVPLYIEPRAEDFLRENWAKVTIGGLEHGPVPKVACHTRSCLGNRPLPISLSRAWLNPQWFPLIVLLLLVVLVAAGLYLDAFGIASLKISMLSPLSELLQSLIDQLWWPFDIKGLLEAVASNISACVSSLAHRTYQYFAFFLQALQ